MKRNALFLIVMILLVSISGIASAAGDEDFYWSNINANPLKMGPPRIMTIYIDEEEAPVRLHQISAMHADGGAETGSISIWMGDQQIGSWPWTGQSGYGLSYTYRKSNVDVVLMPGYEYTIRDSDEASWCYNAQSENRGMVELIGRRLNDFNSGTANDTCAAPDPNIDIVLNDKKVVLTDDEGTSVPPLVFSGTLYIPAQVVPAIPGVDVRWDEGMRILYITAKDENGTAADENSFAEMVKKISMAKYRHALIKADDSLWTWGDYPGNGTKDSSMKEAVRIMEDVDAVYTGSFASLALKKDGTLWSWGSNGRGSGPSYRLGTGDGEDRWTPVKILDNVVNASMGLWTGGAVTADGGLYLWGYNADGNLAAPLPAHEGPEYFDVPTRVMEGVADVSCNDYNYGTYCMVLKQDGTLWTFGSEMFGQLGDGRIDLSQIYWKEGGGHQAFEWRPQQILDNVVSIYAGDRTGMAIKADGTLWTWGLNSDGRLGNGGVSNTKAPAKDNLPCQTIPMQIADNVAQATTTYGRQSALLKKDGTVWAFGERYGDVPVKLNIENVVAISGEDGNIAALKSDGTLWNCIIGQYDCTQEKIITR